MSGPFKVLALGGDHIGPEVVEGADLMVVRGNSGGIYYGEPRGREVLSDG